MYVADSKAGGQSQLKVQMMNMGLQDLEIARLHFSLGFGQIISHSTSLFFSSGMGMYILCPYILEECKNFKVLQRDTVNRLP